MPELLSLLAGDGSHLELELDVAALHARSAAQDEVDSWSERENARGKPGAPSDSLAVLAQVRNRHRVAPPGSMVESAVADRGVMR